MKSQTVIITGGTRGFGAGIAEVFKQRGANVWITGRDSASLDEAAKNMGVNGVAADVTRPEDWDRLFDQVLSESGGRLDALINNAGGAVQISPMAEISDREMEDSININLLGTMYGCRRAAPILKDQGSGTIVNISSICERFAWPGWGPYSAAKAGLNQLSRCMHTELRPFGVRVTTLSPSWGKTNFRDAANIEAADPDVEDKMIDPRELGKIVADIVELPDHLVIPEMSLMPLVQEIEPF